MDKSKKFYAVNNVNWGHRWGYKDTSFVSKGEKSVSLSGNRYEICSKTLPNLIPFAEDVLGIEVLPNAQIKEVENKPVAKQKINKPFLEELTSLFDEDRFSASDK